jgi:hypothetical protein
MIPAYGGTKMVVFGGEQPRKSIPAEEENFSSALYMLDVMTMNWTLLSEGEVAGRSSIACTVVGDNFVVWGGMHFVLKCAKEKEQSGCPRRENRADSNPICFFQRDIRSSTDT